MSDYKCIQRIFAIEPDRIERAISEYPEGFHDGVAVVTYNRVYADNPLITDYDNYCEFYHRLKEQRMDVQVNVSCTLGHSDVDKIMVADTFPTMVDCEGNTCLSSGCPRADELKEDIRKTVKLYAELHPSVIWIDDDFRISHHPPVIYGCFCDDCIRKFNEENGLHFTREELCQAIVSDAVVEGKNIRLQWRDFNQSGMVDLVKVISKAIHDVDDNIIIGYMQVNPEAIIYGCPDYKEFIEYSKNKHGEVWFRHGSGFYSDVTPYGVVEKNLSIGRLCAMTEGSDGKVVNLTEEVTLPYTRRAKSMKLTLLEAIMNIGIAGADGVMDEGIKPNLSEQLRSESLVAEMHRKYSYLAKIRSLIEGKQQIGIYPYFNRDIWLYNDKVNHISQMSDMGSRYWHNLFYMGIPFTFRENGAKALLLSGKTVRAMNKEQLSEWLGKGIYMDGSTALEINRIMEENVTGVKKSAYGIENLKAAGTSECFTDHPLNGATAGYEKFNMWGGSGLGAECLELDGGSALSYSAQKAEAEQGIVGMSVYENSYGGRISVSDRGAWGDDILGQSKSTQIQNVMDWLCGGKMPVRVESILRVGQSIWEDDNERIVFLYNTDYDDAKDVRLFTDREYVAEVLSDEGEWKALSEGSEFVIPMIPNWSAVIVKLIAK